MSNEGRLARGKANYEAGKFLFNSETLSYMDSLKNKPKAKEEKKNAKHAK